MQISYTTIFCDSLLLIHLLLLMQLLLLMRLLLLVQLFLLMQLLLLSIYSFTAPPITPCTNCFWKTIKIRRIGIVAMDAARRITA